IEIQTTSFKNENLTHFDLVKIDVEGAESFVIKSLFEVCQNAIIICEILPVYNEKNVDRLKRQNEIEDLLKINNYSIFRIEKSPVIKLNLIHEIGVHGDIDQS